MTAKHVRSAARLCCAAALGLGSSLTAAAGESADIALAANATKEARVVTSASSAIPWSEVGAKAGADYRGDGLSVVPTAEGARLRCVFQRLEGEATREGLWLSSTVSNGVNERFRVMAVLVGRTTDFGLRRQSAATTALSEGREAVTSETGSLPAKSGVALRFPPQSKILPRTGTVEVADKLVRFVRPGLVEEYSVSMEGVQQDFVITEPPAPILASRAPSPLNGERAGVRGAAVHEALLPFETRDCEGALLVELAVTGAKVEPLGDGVQLVLDKSGRKIAYNRLRVTDATGRELPARMEVVEDQSEGWESRLQPVGLTKLPAPPLRAGPAKAGTPNAALAVVVNDAGAVYPVRIDPTFSDANWISMNPRIPGVVGGVYAAVHG